MARPRAGTADATSVSAPGSLAAGAKRLPVAALYKHCPAGDLRFETTGEVPDVNVIVGQERAVEAIDLAITSTARGFNVFALGPPGIGKATAIHQFLGRRAADVPTPDDWCYVHRP